MVCSVLFLYICFLYYLFYNVRLELALESEFYHNFSDERDWDTKITFLIRGLLVFLYRFS
jgi:hypothetical protein